MVHRRCRVRKGPYSQVGSTHSPLEMQLQWKERVRRTLWLDAAAKLIHTATFGGMQLVLCLLPALLVSLALGRTRHNNMTLQDGNVLLPIYIKIYFTINYSNNYVF